MDTLYFPMRDFDQVAAIRAERHEHLRGRNNVTSCRSPTREINTRLIKDGLREKRHLEFLRRRSVSPGATTNSSSRRKPSSRTVYMKHYNKSETLHRNIPNSSNANGHTGVTLTPNSVMEGPETSKWASLWSEQTTTTRQEMRTQATTSNQTVKETDQNRKKSKGKRDNTVNVQKTTMKTFVKTEKIQPNFSVQHENILQKIIRRESGVQTESGLVTVRESEVQRLADYLQEALWREDAVKKKLAALQESTSNLVNSSGKIWTTRCSEDLLRNKIKALEAQLQVCLQKFPKDAVKKRLLQMEKQKLVYEEKALVALQEATQEKTEALIMVETLKEALITAKAESLRWQSLYEELKLSSGQLRKNQQLIEEHLQQLQNQVELSRAREAELREETLSLRQEKTELQYSVSLLEEDNQMLREEMENLREDSSETQDFVMLGRLTSEESEPRAALRRDSQVEEQLRHAQEKLQLKEKECEELQTELHAMEQECQSSQARLSQCRDELRQLGQRRSRPTPCGSRWKVFIFFLLLMTVAGVAMLWLWYPPFREQIEDLYSDVETRIENYLMEMASPRHSSCFRPV